MPLFLGSMFSGDRIAPVLVQLVHLTYGQSRESSVNVVFAKLLRKMVGMDEKLTSKSKINLSRLPSPHSRMVQHVQRVNLCAALYKE